MGSSPRWIEIFILPFKYISDENMLKTKNVLGIE